MPELAQRTGLERHTLTKYLESLEGQGMVYHKKAGMAKVWYPAENPMLRLLSENTPLSACFKNTLDAMEDGITILDKEMNIVWANKKMREKHGQTKGRCHAALGKEEECANCPAKKAASTGRKQETRIQLNQQQAKITLTPIKDYEGKTVGMLETARWE